MPPKASVAGSLLASIDPENEVVCPLQNQDGSNCRKRCIGEKRYRSMQEHIRRAHPDHYIPKLPATEESFQLMITTPPSQRPPVVPSTTTPSTTARRDGVEPHIIDTSAADSTHLLETQGPATANAAVALTQLHNWDSDYEGYDDLKPERVLGLPSIHDTLPPFQPSRRELLPSILTSPTGRYASLPPIYRREKNQRPRKESMGQQARKGKHERGKSKDYSSIKEFSRRFSTDGRKAMSAEPPTAAWMQGKRWEDLIEAATTATDLDDDRDLTPMPQSPNFPPVNSTAQPSTAGGGGDGLAPPAGPLAGAGAVAGVAAHTPAHSHSHSHPHASITANNANNANNITSKRSSLPPASSFRALGSHLQPHHHYNASPLQRTLTPPPPDAIGPNDPEPFPSIESGGSGQNFHISRSGLPTSASSNDNVSPHLYHAHPYQHSQSSSFGSRGDLLEIYCASCGRPYLLKHAFACTECICAICGTCAGQIMNSPVSHMHSDGVNSRRGCPRCGVVGGHWKRFQLDFR